jgi:hypothetical protein
MKLRKITMAASVVLATSMAMAESAPRAVDLKKLYARYEKAGYSSLELIDTTKRVLISGIVLDVGESLNGNLVLAVGVHANSQQLARLTSADDAQESKLKSLQVGAKVMAVCDLAFSSGAQHFSFQECSFK